MLTTKNTKIHEKEQIHFTMKNLKGHEVNPGSAGRQTGFKHFAFGD